MDGKLKPSHSRKYARDTAAAYLYLAPALIILIVFHFFPAFYALYLSLFDTNLFGRWNWVGLGNYAQLLQDQDFLRSLANTGKYVLGTVPVGIALALGIAALLNQPIRGLASYRTAFFLPYVTPVVAISIVWTWIYKEDSAGMLNAVLSWFGISPQAWLLDPKWAMFALCLMSIWRHLGYNVVIFLAGLQNIPAEYYEAAEIDGASGWAMFSKITWPLLSPTTYFITIISIIGSFQVFTQVYVLWPSALGGPLGTTRVVVKYLYDMAWGSYQFGYASAIGYMLFAIIFVLTLIQRNVAGRYVHYQ